MSGGINSVSWILLFQQKVRTYMKPQKHSSVLFIKVVMGYFLWAVFIPELSIITGKNYEVNGFYYRLVMDTMRFQPRLLLQ